MSARARSDTPFHAASVDLERLILRIARRLGLRQREVARYARQACGRRWRRLGRGDLLLVLDQLCAVAATGEGLHGRRGHRARRPHGRA